jgi:signal transduction histidine kinase/ligand-binding sensor domain-containing protein
MLRARALAALLCGCLLVLTARAQQFHFEVFKPENGLPASGVYAIDQDDNGYIWIATSEGLARYDGAHFLTFDVSSGLREQRIYSMARARDGSIWLGTEQGASRYDGYFVENFTHEDGLGAGTIWSLDIDSTGRVWMASHAGGLSVHSDGRFRTFTTEDGLPSASVYAVTVDDADRIWIGFVDAGLTLAEVTPSGDLSVIRTWGSGDAPGLLSVRTIVQEPDTHRMIVGTRGSGIYFVEEDLSIVRPDIRLGTGDVYSLAFNDRGRLIVGTADSGVRICQPPDYRRCNSLERENGLPSDEILTTLEDREGNLWIGSGLGLYRWSGHQFIAYTEREGLRSNRVLGVSIESAEIAWISTTDGVTRLDLGRTESAPLQVRSYTTDDGLPSNEVWQTLRDGRGRLWFATADGVCLFTEGQGCRVFEESDGLTGSYILTLFEDRAGALWVGSTGGATRITGLDDGTFQIEAFDALDGMAGTDVYAIAQDLEGRIWFASAGGVNMYDGRSIRSWTPEDGLVVGTINDILVSKAGQIWVATSGAGIARYEPEKGPSGYGAFRTWRREDGLPSSTVMSLVEDDSGLIWLGTLDGIVQIDPARIDSGENFVLRHLVSSDGIGSHDPGSGNAFALGEFGDLWFGLANGATRYLPFGPQLPDVAPVVVIESIHVGDTRVFGAPFSYMSGVEAARPSGTSIVIPPRLRDLEVEYHGISVRRQKDISYQTWLEGYEEWSATTKRSRREFTNLPPGDYSFHVRSRLDGSSWGIPATVSFAIEPVFWERTWFRFLVVLLALAAIFAAHKLRLVAVAERNRELRELVAERTHALELRTSELERANELILEADRAKSQFLANMSHELRTPLNSIIGFTDILLERGASMAGDMPKRFLTNVAYSARHLLSLINDVLDISKIEAGRMEVHVERVAVGELIDATIETIRGLADPKRIRIEKDVPEALPLVWLDGTKVRQILFNLLSNAVKFSAPGSKVDVAARLEAAESSPLGVESVRLSVIDRGEGIAEEQLATIFEAYQQARASARLGLGTGLGLAIVRKFSELQGGQVSVTSTLHEGATFEVLLPVDARAHDTDRTSSGKLRVIH